MNHTTALRGSALVFLVTYLAAAFLPTLPEGAYDDARVAELLTGADRTLLIVGGYLLVLAGISALVFVQALAAVLPAGRPVAATVVRAAGAGYGVLLLVASLAFTTIPMATAVDELPGPPPVELFRVFTQAGFFALLVPALLCAALVVTGTSLALRGTDAPKWLAASGLVVAPLLLLGFAWVPQFLVPLWAVAASFGVRGGPPRH